jgi:uncharacterized membrane protein YcfT
VTPPVRLGWVDAAKGMAMLAVVYFHVTLFLGEVGVDDALGRVKLAFELFPMPAFFLLSGLLNRRSATWTFGELWRRRLLPILYIYVVWSLLRFAFYTAFPNLVTDVADASPNNPMTIVWLPVLPTSSYWFVYALALFTLAAWLIRKLPPLVQLGIAAVISAGITSGWLDTHTIAWDRIGALFFFFLLGTLEWRRIRIAVARSPWWVIAIAAVVLLGQIATLYLPATRILGRVPFYVLIAQMLAVFLGFQVARLIARASWLGFVSLIGRQSLPIYLIHLFLIAPIAALFALVSPAWPRLVDIGVCVVITAVVVVLCLLIAKLSTYARWLFAPPRWMGGTRRRRATSTATLEEPLVVVDTPAGESNAPAHPASEDENYRTPRTRAEARSRGATPGNSV